MGRFLRFLLRAARAFLMGFLPAAVVIVSFGVARAIIATKPQLAPDLPVENVYVVATHPVRYADLRPALKPYGEIVSGREVELRALVGGEVVRVGENFVDGGAVHKGDLLLQIDSFNYQAAIDDKRAQLAEAKARVREIEAHKRSLEAALTRDREQLELWKRQLSRTEKLARRGTASEKVLDDAKMSISLQLQTIAMRRNDVDGDKARLDQQQAVIARIDVALRRARRDLRQTRLLAPFDGYVQATSAELGKRLGINDRVTRLIDVKRLEVRFQLSDKQFGHLIDSDKGLIGEPLSVDWQIGETVRRYRARIHRIAPRIESASGGIDLHARLLDHDLQSPLRPGAFVTVVLPYVVYRQVARLPEAALHGQSHVFVVVAGRLEKRRVELVARIANDVLLRGEIRDGDSVVVTRYSEIGPGAKVEVRGR